MSFYSAPPTQNKAEQTTLTSSLIHIGQKSFCYLITFHTICFVRLFGVTKRYHFGTNKTLFFTCGKIRQSLHCSLMQDIIQCRTSLSWTAFIPFSTKIIYTQRSS